MKNSNFWLLAWWVVCLELAVSTVCAQTETSDSIHINASFLKDLENAFEFAPRQDTIRYRDELLTRQQLHEWVGDVDTLLYQQQRHHRQLAESDSLADTLRLDPRFLGLCAVKQPASIMFPDFSKEITMWKSRNNRYSIIRTNCPGPGTAISGLDVKKGLSNLLIPKYRKINKVRKIAEKNKTAMDAAFPL